MDFSGQKVLAFIEEDNTQRTYFRVRPLLTTQGTIPDNMKSEFPDEGFIRIVPDKNEQHTFKERMKSLGQLCMLNLAEFPAEAKKIRPNKNYSPEKQEVNQFIIYSDAVQSLPETLFYQIVNADGIQSALTEFVYIRDGANILGPYRKDGSPLMQEALRLPPDSCKLFNVVLPDGRSLLVYCSAAEEKASDATPEPAPAPAVSAPEAEPVSSPADAAPAPASDAGETAPASPASAAENARDIIETINDSLQITGTSIKSAPNGFSQTAVQGSVRAAINGTRLYSVTQDRSVTRQTRNTLAEAVERQRSINRFESRSEAPGAMISETSRMDNIDNPVEHFRSALSQAWNTPSARNQIIDCLLSRTEIKSSLSKALCGGEGSLSVQALQLHLQDLEAERLMLIMQLDDARSASSSYRDSVRGDLVRESQSTLAQLEKEIGEKKKALEAIRADQAALLQEQKDLLAQINSLSPSLPHLRAPAGLPAEKEKLLGRVSLFLQQRGFLCTKDDAFILLLTLALSLEDGTCRMVSDTLSDSFTAAKALSDAIGACSAKVRVRAEQDRYAIAEHGGDGFVFTCDTRPVSASLPGTVHFVACSSVSGCENEKGRELSEALPCPSCYLEVNPDFIPAQIAPAEAPVSAASIRALAEEKIALNEAEEAFIRQVCTLARKADHPLPIRTVRLLSDFLSAAKGTVAYGSAAAMDYAFRAAVVPHILTHRIPTEPFAALLASMPASKKALRI
ncbi:MAG: hypothetical protein K5746_10105 [Clostridiales bacterium]|nr:hypothetical protein [Clostridiales bacterium]